MQKLTRTIHEGRCLGHGVPVLDYFVETKSYANRRRKPLEFEVGDKVMLKVSPWKGVIRFGKRGKLNPRYIGPFRIIAKVGTLAYRLELPEQLSRVHSTFHVSNREGPMEFEMRARVYLGARGPNEEKVPSSFR
ncbi:hypothetical protein Tco_1503361 [Tanacetum coccineum]